MPAKHPTGCAPLERRLLGTVAAKQRGRVKLALEVMYRAHAGQKRDEGIPYATHPISVALIAVNEARLTGRDAVIAALLHDVLEDDMSTTPEHLRRQFGKTAADAVVALTKMYKRDGGAKPAGLKRYYATLRAAAPWVRAIKLCDRLHNLRSLPASNPTEADVADYARETRRKLLPLAKGAKHAGLARAARLVKAELPDRGRSVL